MTAEKEKKLMLNGPAIRRRRKELRLTTTEAAAAIGCAEPYLRDLESGRQENTSLRLVGGLMIALNAEFKDVTKWGFPSESRKGSPVQRAGRAKDRGGKEAPG